MRELLAESLVFIDESGINLALTRMRARSPRGQRAYGERPQKRGKNISLVGALSLDGVVTQQSVMGAVDGITFEAFIACKLVPNLRPGTWIIMDNCSVHKGEEVKRLIEEAGCHLIYLPPYSPDFSPIENCWSKVKAVLRAIGARTHPDLLKAVEEAFSRVSLKDIRNWFAHCCYCTSPA